MRSHGQLFDRVIEPSNLERAMLLAARGKRDCKSVQAFLAAAPARLAALRNELADGSYRPGAYEQFGVLDPKPRTISCSSFRDRVVHHAVCDVIAPVLERRFSGDSYACRKGKGTHLAAARAREYAGRFAFVCKLDVRSFFDSVDHEALLGVLLPLFRERRLRALLDMLVRHPFPGQTPGRGLPIGNLTSQWCANLYLDGLDHYAKEDVRVGGYVRYMDDMVLFAESKAELWAAHDAVRDWLARERRLELKAEATVLCPCREGFPFLGLRIFPGCWRLQRQRFVRTRRLVRRRERQCARGDIDAATLAASVRAAIGGLRWFGFKGVLHGSIDA